MEIFGNYEGLAEFMDTCIPTLRELVNRPENPLPSVRVSPRKLIFVKEQVEEWLAEEARRQAGKV